MGNRRFSRKRLFEVEKRGQAVDLEAAEGIKDAIVSATQHRNGAELITEIAVDLGTSKATITSGGADTKASGVTGKAAAITQLTTAKFGNITEYRVVIVEAPTIGGVAKAINVAMGSASQNTAAAVTGHTEINGSTGLNTVGQDESLDIDTIATHQAAGSEEFLYITADDTDVGNYDGGKVLIYLHGFVAPADI